MNFNPRASLIEHYKRRLTELEKHMLINSSLWFILGATLGFALGYYYR